MWKWNYRVVRKKSIYIDTTSKQERVDYTYAIHEAYYDNNGYVGAITQNTVGPFGENIEELRHSWVMMAEAFGQQILDHDHIPEPGYKRKEDPVRSVLDTRLKELEAGRSKGIPLERVTRDLEKKLGPFDEEQHGRQVQEERVEKERVHGETFVGTPTLEELMKKLYFDYREHI